MAKVNNKQNEVLSAVEIMKVYNLTYQAINHYTNFGLLPVALKKGNARFYSKDMLEQHLKEIKKLTEEGYSLRLIRKKLIGI